MTRNVLPQIAPHVANASHGRAPTGLAGQEAWPPEGFAAELISRALGVPAQDALRNRFRREAEMLLDRLERRRLAEAIDADGEPTLADEAVPVVGDAGLQRHAHAAGRQHRVAPRLVLDEEALRRGHADDAHRHAAGFQ